MAAVITPVDPTRLTVALRRGALVTYGGFFAGKIIIFANTVILARLLAPEHFGLVAIGLLVLAVSEALAEAGTGAAVVWRQGAPEKTAAVALALALIAGGVMATGALLAAPALARLFEEPLAAPVIRVFALCILLSAPAAVFAGILQRHMAFGRRILPEIARALIKGMVGIPLALAGFGVWSLVYAQLAAVALGLLLVARLSGWRPRLSLDRAITAQVLPYAAHIAAIGLLGVVMKRLDVVIVGARFEAEALGYYTLAFSLVELAVLGLCWSAGQALFPALSQKAQEAGELRRTFTEGLSALMMVIFPLAVGLAVAAEPFILTLYGAKWAPAVPLIQVLAFYALIYAAGFNLGDIYKATGRPQVLSWINLATLALALPLLLLASRWGLAGIAAGQVAVAAAATAINWCVATRLTGLGPRVLRDAATIPALASCGAALAARALDRLALEHAADPLRLLVICIVGSAVYLLLLAGLSQPLRRRLSLGKHPRLTDREQRR